MSTLASTLASYSELTLNFENSCSLIQEVSQAIPTLHQNSPNGLQASDLQDILSAFTLAKHAVVNLKSGDQAAANIASAIALPFWLEHFLPMIDTCLYSTRWHQSLLTTDTSPAKEHYQKIQVAVRDLFQSFLELTTTALQQLQNNNNNQQPSTTTTTNTAWIAPLLSQVLSLAHTAAELIGWRDPRANEVRTIRNYSLLNMVWQSTIKLWSVTTTTTASTGIGNTTTSTTSSSLSINQLLVTHGLGADTVAQRLLSYLDSDIQMLCTRKEVADVKLLQFWVMLLGKTVSGCGEVAPLVGGLTVQWMITARQCVYEKEASNSNSSSIGGGGSGNNSSSQMVSLVAAINKASLWSRAGRLVVQCLAHMPDSMYQPAIADLHNKLATATTTQQQPPVVVDGDCNATAGMMMMATASAVLDILAHSAAMSAQLQHACLSLIPASLQCLAAAETTTLTTTTNGSSSTTKSLAVDALLAYSLACAKKYSDAPQPHQHQQQQQPPSVEAQLWQDFQLSMLESTVLQSCCPTIGSILSHVWCSFGRLCDQQTAEQYSTTLTELLCHITALETSRRGYYTAAPLVLRLTNVLAAFLTTAPAVVRETCFTRSLQLCPLNSEDVCYLAYLSALLRVATLVDGCAIVQPQQQQQQQRQGSSGSNNSSGGGSSQSRLSAVVAVVEKTLHQLTHDVLQRCVTTVTLLLSPTVVSGGTTTTSTTSGSGTTREDVLYYLSWVCDCMGGCTKYLSAVYAIKDTTLETLSLGVSTILTLLTHPSLQQSLHTTTTNTKPPPYLSSSLAFISTAHSINPGTVPADVLIDLLPILTTLATNSNSTGGNGLREGEGVVVVERKHEEEEEEGYSGLLAKLVAAYKDIPTPPSTLFSTLLSSNDNCVLKHMAVESYVEYIRSCDRSNLIVVLPRDWVVDGTAGGMSGTAQNVVQRYLHRVCTTTGIGGTNNFNNGTNGTASKWKVPLQERLNMTTNGSEVEALIAAPRKLPQPTVPTTINNNNNVNATFLVGGQQQQQHVDNGNGGGGIDMQWQQALSELSNVVNKVEGLYRATGGNAVKREVCVVLQQNSDKLRQLANS